MRQCTRNQAAFNIFLYMFGATQIPYAIGQMGWLWGSVFMVTMSVSSYHSGHLLADICVRRRAYSWPAIGLVGFGAAGQYGIEALQTTNFVLSGVVQTQGAGSVWQQAFDRSPICQWEWLLVSTAVFAVFLQIPSFGGSLPMKVATAITIVLTVWRVVLPAYLLPAEGRYCHTCYGGQTAASTLSAAANLVFTFGSHAMMPEEVREMVSPAEVHSAYDLAYAIAIPLYVLLGYSGFYVFGIFNSGANFLLNFPDGPPVRALMVASAVFGYLPLSYGSILLFLKVELRLGVLPTDWLLASNGAANRTRGCPPVLFRLVFRCSVLGVYLLLAQMFLGVGLQNVVSLVGAIAICALTFYLPFVMHARIFWAEMTKLRLAWYALNVLFGVGVSVCGIYFTMQDILGQSSAGVFDAACRENAFFLGSAPADAYSCSNDTVFYREFYERACVQGDIACSQYGSCYPA